jgi:O-antigen ligase
VNLSDPSKHPGKAASASDGRSTKLERAMFGSLLLLALSAPFSIAISQSALTLALLSGAIAWALPRGQAPVRTGIEVALFAFVAWALLTIPFSGEPMACLRHAKRFLLLPALWLFATNCRDERRRLWLLAVLAIGAAGVAVYGIADYLQGVGGLLGRAKLTQGYMTAGGLMMLCGLVILAFLLRARTRRLQLLLAAALLPVLVALLVTYTRSAWIGFAAGAGLLLLLARPKLAPVYLLLLLIGASLAPDELRGRLLSSFDPSHRSNVQRVIMWRTGWEMMKDHPLTGTGDRDLESIYLSYHEGEDVEAVGHLHSNYIMFGVLWGWPGLALLLLFLGRLCQRLWRRWREEIARERLTGAGSHAATWALAAMACWLGFMLGGLFEWNFGDAEIALLLWSVCGMGLAPASEPHGQAYG